MKQTCYFVVHKGTQDTVFSMEGKPVGFATEKQAQDEVDKLPKDWEVEIIPGEIEVTNECGRHKVSQMPNSWV